MSFIQESILWLDSLGTFTILLPFFLVFLIFFGLLQRVKIWGKGGSNYNAVIAFSLAFLAIYQLQIAARLSEFIMRMGIAFIALVILMIFAGMLDLREQFRRMIVKIALIAFIAYSIIDVFFNSSAIGAWIQANLGNEMVITISISVVIFLLIIGFVMREEKQNTGKPKREKEKAEPKKIPLKEEEKEMQKPITEEEYRKNLKERFPGITDEQIDADLERQRKELLKKIGENQK